MIDLPKLEFELKLSASQIGAVVMAVSRIKTSGCVRLKDLIQPILQIRKGPERSEGT